MGVEVQAGSPVAVRVNDEAQFRFRKPPSATPVAGVLETVAAPFPCVWTTKVPTLVSVSPLTVTPVVLFGPRNMYAEYGLSWMVLPDRFTPFPILLSRAHTQNPPTPTKNPAPHSPPR